MCVPARGSTCAEAGSERSWTVKRFSVAGVLGTLGEGGCWGWGEDAAWNTRLILKGLLGHAKELGLHFESS